MSADAIARPPARPPSTCGRGDGSPQTPTLPPLLRRPGSDGTVARLTWHAATPSDDPERGEPLARWRLKGSPAPVLLGKRLFAGAISRQNDLVSWPAVPAAFEDLLMLMHRYPIEVAGGITRTVWEHQYADLLQTWSGLRLPDAQVPGGASHFLGKLLPFQEEGVRFLAARRRSVCADEMGLGKTLQGLAFIDRVAEYPAVIVCQPHVQSHWERKIPEFLRVAPPDAPLPMGLRWRVLRGTKSEVYDPTRPSLYLVHYLVLHAWADWLVKRGIRTVVFDEVQELRHGGTSKHDACLKLTAAARNVIGLSGTPIYNRGIEMFTVLNAVDRGCLGTKVSFQSDWCEGGKSEVVEDPGLLGTYLRDRGLMIRRRKEDVLTDLPDKRRVVEKIDADNEMFAKLVLAAQSLARQAEEATNPFDRARLEREAIAETRRATGVAKAPAVIGFLRGLMEAGEPTLVFAHHHAVHDLILQELSAHGPVSITGRETMALKAQSQDRFAAGETNLCLIGLRAATGIDGLQKRARVVVFAELDWSPAVHRQAEDRAHRMGQRDSVLAYYLVTDVGTDPWMMGALAIKESQYLGIMHDPEETDADRADAEARAKEHMAGVLRMLRGER